MMMMTTTEPDDEVNSGLAVRRRTGPDELISLVVAEFHLGCRLLNFVCYIDLLRSASGKDSLSTVKRTSTNEKCNPRLDE